MNELSDNVLGAIGNTPLVKLSNISRGSGINIYAKLEYFNPGLSIKDRVALKFIDEAEKMGKIKQGDENKNAPGKPLSDITSN